MKKKAFTLVELIVVITILAILGTISFISLQGYTREARDSKRLSDVNNIFKKISLERTKGIYPSNLMINGINTSTGLTLGGTVPTESKQGTVNFLKIKEEENDFKDPKGNDYVLSYAVGGSGTGAYKFIQLATINEEKNEAVLVGDYYKILPTDSPSLVYLDPLNLNSGFVEDKKSVLPYGNVPIVPVITCEVGYTYNVLSSTCVANNCIGETQTINAHNYNISGFDNGVSTPVISSSFNIYGGTQTYSQNFLCSLGNIISDGSETLINTVCDSGYHEVVGTCESNIRSCNIVNGIGQETWNGTSWGICTVQSCNSGYNISGNICYKISLLMHMEGAHGGTIFSEETGKTITRVGAPTTNTSVKYFGSASSSQAFSSQLNVASSSDFNVGSGDFTVEGWFRFSVLPPAGTNGNLFTFHGSTKTYNPYIYIWSDGNFALRSAQTSGTIILQPASIALNTFYHIAVVKSGTTFYLFKNGVLLGSGTSTNIANEDKSLTIGGANFQGYIDEFRVTKGLARYTTNFTVPTADFTYP